MSAPCTRETLLSQVYAGNQHGAATLRASVQATEGLLALTPEQRRRTVWRTDGGFGTDENINWLLWRGYQVLSKGYNGKRAKAYARQVAETDWHPLRADRWVGLAPHPPRYGRKTVTLVLRWLNESGQERYATLVSSLMEEDPFTLPARFDGRGAMESEVKTDKGGLLLPKRRKKQLCAQEGLILLTDLAHNLLAWTHGWMLAGSPFATWGLSRLVQEGLCIPGRVVIKDGHLEKVALLRSHPYAGAMLECVNKLLQHFGNP